MAHDPKQKESATSSCDLNFTKISNRFDELDELRKKLLPFEGDEFEFDDLFENIYDIERQNQILKTIATLPNSMWIYFKKNGLISNINETDTKLHIVYGHMIQWYRNKSIADEHVMKQLMKEKEQLQIEINELKNNYCFYINNDMIKNKPNNLYDMQMQARYLNIINDSFNEINLHYSDYMNGEDRRIAQLLEEHSKKDKILVVSFHKFCINKYKLWLKLNKHLPNCPEDNFEQ